MVLINCNQNSQSGIRELIVEVFSIIIYRNIPIILNFRMASRANNKLALCILYTKLYNIIINQTQHIEHLDILE